MIAIDALVAFSLASFLLALAPGPDNIFVLIQSALYGYKAGIWITPGLCTGLIFHTMMVALGIAVIFQTSVFAFTLLKLIGVIYLLYLAWFAFHANAFSLALKKETPLTMLQFYRRGIIMNITNPKVSLFFLAFLPQFIAMDNGFIAQQVLLLGGIFIIIAWIVFVSIALLAAQLSLWFNRALKAQIYLHYIAGLIFIGLALKLLTTRI